MKTLLTSFVVFLVTINIYGQQKNYINTTIASWSFEKFPNHFIVTPAKTSSQNDVLNGKLQFYHEYNSYGQSEGLSLTMQNNGVYPYSALYTFKGQIVYTAQYFGNSSIASSIKNWNLDGNLDGPQITRTLKTAGGYTEEIQIFDNGNVISINGIKQEPFVLIFTSDSLLDGKFKFRYEFEGIVEGIARNGEIISLQKYILTEFGKVMIENIQINIDSVCIRKKEKESDASYYSEVTFPIVSKVRIAKSKNNIESGYGYLLINGNGFSVPEYISMMKEYQPTPIESITSFKDSLLEGMFQFRVFEKNKNISNYSDNKGETVNGYLKTLTVQKYSFNRSTGDSKTLQEESYSFDNNDFHLQLTNSQSLVASDSNKYFLLDPSTFCYEHYKEHYIANKNAAEKIEKLKAIEIMEAFNRVNDSLMNLKKSFSDKITEFQTGLKSKPSQYTEIEEYKDYTGAFSALESNYRGHIVKKAYSNIYSAYTILLIDSEKKDAQSANNEMLWNQIRIVNKFIEICSSDDCKAIEKKLKGVSDVSEIKKLLNL